MTPEDLAAAGLELFGKKWKAPLARGIGVTPSTLWRYLSGQIAPIPLQVQIIIRLLLAIKRKEDSKNKSRPSKRRSIAKS